MIELRATDLRQYLYCARVVYFTYVIPVSRVETFRMGLGRRAEAEHVRLEPRRRFTRYRLERGNRRFRVPVFSPTLGVSGEVDEVIDTADGPIPVEVKRTGGRIAAGHRVQLTAYAMALGEASGVAVPRGYVHVLPRQEVIPVEIDENLRAMTRDVARRIRCLIDDGVLPPAADKPAKCDGCELRGFCNDVY
jgi:CRISPR-associated exonuclease Cas4